MTFQAVIILTCNFWFVFGSFLACEQLSNYGEQSEPGENARARAEAPRTGELARRRFFSLSLCYCTSWGRRFSSSFLALEASQRWNEKNEPQSVKTWVQFVNEEKPLRAGTQGFIDGPVFFSLYEMPMSSTDHKNAYIFQPKIQLVAMSKSWKIQFCELLAIE